MDHDMTESDYICKMLIQSSPRDEVQEGKSNCAEYRCKPGSGTAPGSRTATKYKLYLLISGLGYLVHLE